MVSPAKAPAPGELEVVQRYVNTADLEDVADHIPDPAALAAWLGAHGLEVTGGIDAQTHQRALGLREAIRGLALANNGGPTYAVDLGILNRAAGQSQLRARFAAGGMVRLESEAPAGSVEHALGPIIAAVFGAMATGSWGRLKACRRHSCRWVFYDASKNRSSTWCRMDECGNRAKAERFRARKRKRTSATGSS